MGTGPVTGPLEWLSQEPLEKRKAAKLIVFSAPKTIRGIQMAERGLLRSAHSAEVADRRRAIGAEFAALLKAAEQRIVAHVQGKIASIDPALSMAARHAAIEQLIAEQTAAILQLKQDIKQQRRHARRAAGTSLRGKFKSAGARLLHVMLLSARKRGPPSERGMSSGNILAGHSRRYGG